MVFWDKAQPVILRGKKVLVHQQQNQLFKGIFTCQSQGSEREYFPIARGPFYIEFIFSSTCIALPCPPISVLTENLSWATNLFFLPRHPPFLTHSPNLLNIFKKIQRNLKKCLNYTSLKLLQTSKLFRRVKIVLMKRSQNSTLRVGASQFHMQASCRVMK